MSQTKIQIGVPSKEFQEAYYDKFWSRPDYSSKQPNREEQERYIGINKMLELIPFPDDRKAFILDLGCGRGWLSNLLTSYGSVLGIDLLESSTKHANRLFPQLDFRTASTKDLLMESYASTFDLIVCSEVIEHVPATEQRSFLQEIFLLLKPNGYLILTTPRGELWKNRQRTLQKQQSKPQQSQPINDWLTEKMLTSLCQNEGFTVCVRTRAYHPSTPLNWQGVVRKYFLTRKYIRQIQFPWLNHWISYEAQLYQVLLVKRS